MATAPQFLTLPQARDLLEAYRFDPRDAEQYVAMALAAGKVRSTQPGAGPLLYFPNGVGISLPEMEAWIPRAPIVDFQKSTILVPHRDVSGLLLFVATVVTISHSCLQKLLIETMAFRKIHSEDTSSKSDIAPPAKARPSEQEVKEIYIRYILPLNLTARDEERLLREKYGVKRKEARDLRDLAPPSRRAPGPRRDR